MYKNCMVGALWKQLMKIFETMFSTTIICRISTHTLCQFVVIVVMRGIMEVETHEGNILFLSNKMFAA